MDPGSRQGLASLQTSRKSVVRSFVPLRKRRRDGGAFPRGPALELEFQRHLQLPSRTEVPRRKARAGYPSERRALGIQIGVPKVGMIEHVKRFGTELQVHALSELRVLDQ